MNRFVAGDIDSKICLKATDFDANGDVSAKDITLMKEFNVNAVRMSHYPPDPILIRLCDEYGLYVIDEADIETAVAVDTIYPFDQAFKKYEKHNADWRFHPYGLW